MVIECLASVVIFFFTLASYITYLYKIYTGTVTVLLGYMHLQINLKNLLNHFYDQRYLLFDATAIKKSVDIFL